jgi:hypothetical protein
MVKKPDTIVSEALRSNPKQNVKDAEKLFGSDEGSEVEEANKELREQREAGSDQSSITGRTVGERFGSPD